MYSTRSKLFSLNVNPNEKKKKKKKRGGGGGGGRQEMKEGRVASSESVVIHSYT